MEIMEIIKEALIFPSQNLEKLVIYILLLFVVGILFFGGIFTGVLGIQNSSIFLVLTFLLFALGIIIALIITGYQIDLLKSGIDHDENAPDFDWMNNLVTGIKMLIVSIIYFIIPAIVTLIVAFITNIPGQTITIIKQASAAANTTAVANSSASVIKGVSDATLASWGTSVAITTLVAFVVFVIFAFLQTMGESRLANTGSLGEAINIPEAFRDITRIGIGKVVAVVLLIVIIIVVINAIIAFLSGQVAQLSIISVVASPYLAFFTQRAVGLLYSDIA